MKKKWLLRLAKLLDRVPRDNFDMSTYAEAKRPMKKAAQCATAACALGWATRIPECAKAGLELRCNPGDTNADIYLGGKWTCGADAARAVFELNSTQVSELFFRGPYDPKEKAKQIRAMVRAAA